MTEETLPAPEETGTTAPPVEETETFDSPTSNDVGEQTLTQADIAEAEAEEGEAEAEADE